MKRSILILLAMCGTALAQPTPVPGLQRCAHDSSLTGDCRVATPIGAHLAVGGGLDDAGGTTGITLLTTCSSGQILKWNGTVWACGANGTGDITAVIAGTGLTGGATSGDATLEIIPATLTTIDNASHVVAWGDSITSNEAGGGATAAYVHQLGLLTGYTDINEGVSGNTSTQIKTRLLAAMTEKLYPTIILAGRNNFNSPATVQSDIAAMVAALAAAGNTNYIVLSVTNADVSGEWSGGSDYNTIIALNTALAATYGSHYLDVRAYLVSLYDSGIPQDVIDHSHDVMPSSLRFDSVHPNAAGELAIANFLAAHMAPLQGDPVRSVVESDLPGLFRRQFSTITVNCLPKGSGTSLVTSTICEDGTTITLGGSKLAITEATGSILHTYAAAPTTEAILALGSTTAPTAGKFTLWAGDTVHTGPDYTNKRYILGYNYDGANRATTSDGAVWLDLQTHNGSSQTQFSINSMGTDGVLHPRYAQTSNIDGSAGATTMLATTYQWFEWGGSQLMGLSSAAFGANVPTTFSADSTSILSAKSITGNTQVFRVGTASQETDVPAYVIAANPQMYLWNPAASGTVTLAFYANNGAKVATIEEGLDSSFVLRNSASGGITYLDLASGGMRVRNSSFANTATMSDAGAFDVPLGQISGLSVRTNGSTGPKWTGGTGAPAASCAIGDEFSRTDGAAGTVLYTCTATNTWTAIAGGVGTITGVTAGTGLSGGGTSGTVTLNLANTAVTAASYTNASITVDAQGRLTAASSGTAPVTSVSAGTGITITGTTTPSVAITNTAVTAASYTCTNLTVNAQGQLTAASNGSCGGGGITNSAGNNVVMKSNGTNAVASSETDDGTTFSIGASKLTVTVSTGATTIAGQLSAQGTEFLNGTLFAQNTSQAISFDSNTNGTSTANINTTGYSGGTTQARSVIFYDGQGSSSGHQVLKIDGTNTNVSIPNGTLTVAGAVTNSSTEHTVGAVTFDSTLGVSGLATLTGGFTTSADGTVNGNLNVTSRFGYQDAKLDKGTQYTVSLCGTTPTKVGGATSGVVTQGTSPPSTCTITFGTTFPNTPSCRVSTRASNSKTTIAYAVSTTQLTITGLATTTQEAIDFDCSAE